MGYLNEINEEVDKVYTRKKIDSISRQIDRENEIYGIIPRIKEINDTIRSTGLKLTKMALNHNGDIEKSCEEIRQQNNRLIEEKKKLLKDNKYPIDYLDEGVYECRLCNDTGYVKGEKCECLKKLLIKEAYERSNLATIIDKQNFDTFNMNYYSDVIDTEIGLSSQAHMINVYNDCIGFVQNFNDIDEKNLFLYGQSGLGKTFLSSCIAKYLLDSGYSVLYQSATKIFSLITDSIFDRDEDKKEHIKTFYDCDLLIIDDLGTEAITQYTISGFFDLLNDRTMNNKKVIINSNLSLASLDKIYSNRIMSRMADFKLIKFFGNDIRNERNINE